MTTPTRKWRNLHHNRSCLTLPVRSAVAVFGQTTALLTNLSAAQLNNVVFWFMENVPIVKQVFRFILSNIANFQRAIVVHTSVFMDNLYAKTLVLANIKRYNVYHVAPFGTYSTRTLTLRLRSQFCL